MDNLKLDQLKVSAQNFGFDSKWVADVIEKFGPDVLTLAVELARQGFSVAFVVELIEKFGPALLQFLVDYLNQKSMAKPFGAEGEIFPMPPGGIIEGIDSNLIDMIVNKYLPIILQKYLPMIVEKYGPQIVQFLVDWFVKSLQK